MTGRQHTHKKQQHCALGNRFRRVHAASVLAARILPDLACWLGRRQIHSCLHSTPYYIELLWRSLTHSAAPSPAVCRVAQTNFLEGEAFNDAIGELLRSQLS